MEIEGIFAIYIIFADISKIDFKMYQVSWTFFVQFTSYGQGIFDPPTQIKQANSDNSNKIGL